MVVTPLPPILRYSLYVSIQLNSVFKKNICLLLKIANLSVTGLIVPLLDWLDGSLAFPICENPTLEVLPCQP